MALPSPSPGAASPQRPEPPDYRVTEPPEVIALLREMMRQRVLVTIVTTGGTSFTTLLLEVDSARGLLRFSADPRDEAELGRVLASQEVQAVCHLDRIRVQFDLRGLARGRDARGEETLDAALPAELLRFQRRSGYRVRPVQDTPARARFQHPVQFDTTLDLRVIDVSIGGVALFLPLSLLELKPGTRIPAVQVELDRDTRFDCNLFVHHVTRVSEEARGLRLGCEFENVSSAALRALQCFIDLTQRRRLLMARGWD